MNAMTRRSALFCGFGALTACVSTPNPAPGKYRMRDVFEVTFARHWSDFTTDQARGVRLLSLNGPSLDRLYLAALRPDEGLSQRVIAGKRATEISTDVAAAFIAESIDALGFEKPEVSAAPHPFGGADGARVTIATRTRNGLLFDGEARLAAHGGRLCVILHIAAREHYFAATQPDALAVMESVRLL